VTSPNSGATNLKRRVETIQKSLAREQCYACRSGGTRAASIAGKRTSEAPPASADMVRPTTSAASSIRAYERPLGETLDR
jgi:hypothetical protein